MSLTCWVIALVAIGSVKGTRFTCQENPITALEEELAELKQRNVALENRNANLSASLASLSQAMVDEYQKEVVNLSSRITGNANQLEQASNQQAALRTQLKSLSAQVQQLSAVSPWPAGSYCILANGNCPPGFTKSSGHMLAISLYAGTASYITPATFGSSKIKCHGSCGQFGHWTGELYIVACCK